jgi:hypothetical protein
MDKISNIETPDVEEEMSFFGHQRVNIIVLLLSSSSHGFFLIDRSESCPDVAVVSRMATHGFCATWIWPLWERVRSLTHLTLFDSARR